MSSYVTELQEKTAAFLQITISLLNKSHEILYQIYTTADDLATIPLMDRVKSVEELQQKTHDVQVLQIRIPIVAPMKAGKSTSINAVIGGEYLPTRMDAMTALPTAVALKLGLSDVEEAGRVQLILTESTIAAVENLQRNVVDLLKESFTNDHQLKDLLNDNIHLVTTAKNLRDNQAFLWHSTKNFDNSQDIQKVLTLINELVRLSIYLSVNNPNADLSLEAFLKHIPIMNVHYRAITARQSAINHPCQILLIDTPGPNEATLADRLKAFLENELDKADMVLIVVEYGHLNTEADAKIAEYIDRIRRLKKEQECIYILVNKADLRRQRDMSKTDLQRHVAKTYRVQDHCVFELSGSHALIAQRYITDFRQQGQNIVVGESSTAREVLEAYCPIDWEERQTDSNPNEVEQMARNLFKRSGISNILDKVVDTVLGQVIQRCVQSAINTCNENYDNLMMIIDLRLKGIQVAEQKLRQEINDLKQDLADLAAIQREELIKIPEITHALEEKLLSIFEEGSKTYEEGVQFIFNPTNKQWFDSAEIERQARETTDHLAATVTVAAVTAPTAGYGGFSIGGTFTAAVGVIIGLICAHKSAPLLVEYFRDNTNEVQYQNDQKAKEFIAGITDLVNNLSKSIHATVESKVITACNEACKKFTSRLSERTLNIIRRANQGLNKTFSIDLSSPKRLEARIEDTCVTLNDIAYEKERSASFINRLLTNEHNEGSKTWFLSRAKLQEKCENSLKENMKRIQNNIIERTINEMKQTFNSLFVDLKSHLEKYQNHAAWCVKDKSLTQENQATFIRQLNKLNGDLLIQKQQLDTFSKSIDWSRLLQPH